MKAQSALVRIAMFLYASLLVFLVYFSNVAAGAFWDQVYFGDVGEMLVLLAASVLFVVAILQKEAARKNQNDS